MKAESRKQKSELGLDCKSFRIHKSQCRGTHSEKVSKVRSDTGLGKN